MVSTSVGSDQSRFIPAGAGNIRRRPLSVSRETVHPRGCGEHRRGQAAERNPHGSSPRVRGTSRRAACRISRPRFIPAGAGNITCRTPRCTRWSVHPRGCGEHFEDEHFHRFFPGSSPRVRGTYEDGQIVLDDIRFIPAGAGNITGRCRTARGTPVHPRGCGEHQIGGPDGISHRGSSPRVRGTSTATARETVVNRFIPAGAGNI